MSNVSRSDIAAMQDRRAEIEPDPRLASSIAVGAAIALARRADGGRAWLVAHRRAMNMAAAGFDEHDDSWRFGPASIEELVPYQRMSSTRGEQHA
jgi:hypothetical protein